MSSDPVTDLVSSLMGFTQAFRDVLGSNQQARPGSPAARESEGEPFAGQWGDYPSRDILATTMLVVATCADHLTATASMLKERNAVFAPYTVMRAAAEAAAVGVYLTDPDIDARERVRRTMNYRLDCYCEEISLLEPFPGEEAKRKVISIKKRISDIAADAGEHGFQFHKMGGYGRPAHLDEQQPGAMKLVALAVDKNLPGLGEAYQRHLSSVAHAKLHGLTRFLTPITQAEGSPGQVMAAINTTPRVLAVELLGGPVSAANLVGGLRWFTGWDFDDVARRTVILLHTWGRVGGVPYPGYAGWLK
jgi:hypothetical protein